MSILLALSLLVTSELPIKSDRIEEFLQWIESELHVSRSFAGNQQFEVYVETNAPDRILFVEKWETQENFETYIQWRMERGDMEKMAEFLAGTPVITTLYSEILAEDGQ